jgi:lipopolysaccharide transport system permease protein
MNEKKSNSQIWDLVIRPNAPWWDLELNEVWRYRDLVWMFVRRDFVSVYKQTVLGPIWFFIQPLLTTMMFTLVFSNVAKIPTDGLPPMLFYLAGITPWNYFSACLSKTSSTFVSNANIFGKVYFPRLATPIAIVISNLVQFVIQFALFFAFLFYYWANGTKLDPNWIAIFFLTPGLLFLMALLGLGTGIIISSLTTKYRDFTFLVAFGIQLAMYATPVIYPAGMVPKQYRFWIDLNPMSAIIEAFRSAFLGGPIPWAGLAVATTVTFISLFLGILIFKKVERDFMDTV